MLALLSGASCLLFVDIRSVARAPIMKSIAGLLETLGLTQVAGRRMEVSCTGKKSPPKGFTIRCEPGQLPRWVYVDRTKKRNQKI